MQEAKHKDTMNKNIEASIDIARDTLMEQKKMKYININKHLKCLVSLKVGNAKVSVMYYLKANSIPDNKKEEVCYHLAMSLLYLGFTPKGIARLAKSISAEKEDLTLLKAYAVSYITTHVNIAYLPTYSTNDYILDELRQVHSYEEAKKIIENGIRDVKNKIDAVSRLKIYLNKYIDNYRPKEKELKDKINSYIENYKKEHRTISKRESESLKYRDDNYAVRYFNQEKDFVSFMRENKIPFDRFNYHLNAIKDTKKELYLRIVERRDQELEKLNATSERIMEEFNNYIRNKYKESREEGQKVSIIDYMRMYKDYPIELLLYYINRYHPKKYPYFLKFLRTGSPLEHKSRESLYNKSTVKKIVLSYNSNGRPNEIYEMNYNDFNKIYDSLVEEGIPVNNKTFNIRSSEYKCNILKEYKDKLSSSKESLLEEKKKRQEIEEDLLERILGKK